jgi:NhaA family Na+:H+ antiporter
LKHLVSSIREFLALEAAGGIVLVIAALAALALANSPAAWLYERFLAMPLEIRIDRFGIGKPLLLWINDGLMAVFFFLVGLEIKREVLEGELSHGSQIVLPAIAAVGGMAAPAAIYAALNWGDPVALQGWAIPAATDIAFALGVLSLLGERVPNGLKVFLLTLAILDDLGAIVLIAVFYSGNLSVASLTVAAAALIALLALNRSGVQRITPYLLVGLVLWVSVLKSGVHATLAGVALALFIPRQRGPELERDLHPAVAFGILPLFAFANAGVLLEGVGFGALLQPMPLGIAAGLLVGKTVGVFGAAVLAIRLGWARIPDGGNWSSLLGVAVLCGIGFTMSLFIAGLAFEGAGAEFGVQTRLGVLGGSILSALLGYALLRAALPASARPAT